MKPWRIAGLLTASACLLIGAFTGTAGAVEPTTTSACTPAADTPLRQFRAAWVSSVVNIDWPSRTGLTAEQQKAELIGWFEDAVRQRHNAVILQIRPTADAFWPSKVEPWSQYLTGTQGGDPGYDPLAFAVAEAHKRNLELHGWFNPYRLSMGTNLNALVPTHPARLHPDWVVTYGGKLYYNPGIPAARKLVEDAIMDAVANYDLDGVHFDDYFYPYPVAGQVFDDAATYAQYGDGFPTVAAWRRNNIDLLIQELQQRIKAVKPWVKFGISPFAVWRNKATDPLGSDTTAGVQTYDDLAADTRRWVREEWIDYIVPQVYWAGGFAPADYNKIVPWWAEQVRGTRVHLYIGQATYKVGTSTQSPDWSDPAELSDHLAFNTTVPEVKGDIYFSAKDVRADRLGATSLLNSTWYTRPALIPAMPSLDSRAPLPVHALRASRTSAGVKLQWKPTSRDTTSYAIYRRDLAAGDWCADNDARNLLTTLRGTSFVDTTAVQGRHYLYSVTALDRAANQSLPLPTLG
ncbi:glycoside hydrolase family 10 protein [Kribbella sp. CA-293567]|uniref:glycoside hydrolase family 10 protein n=1 Tax=Kribbella sp. CA-293567 TaxID=3002436 RepID=UPI0022DD37E8|nr:family 10 glycosylhydrolase [Kribbella sp. CA-293567]WBQ04938.1 family 10 glycosylhydrolase [Kribbella sp. CA-293567]